MLHPDGHIYTTDVQSKDVYPKHYPEFYVHIIGGIITLFLGPTQFLRSLRKNSSWHRILGRIYVIACLTGGVAGFILAFNAFGGVPSTVGFALLSVVWLVTIVMGYHHVRSHNYAVHREWMIRNYVLTLSSVTIRLYLIPVITANAIKSKGRLFGPEEWQYVICVWLCWIPNMFAGELFIWYTKKK
jgi:uncharacterized membrane protein